MVKYIYCSNTSSSASEMFQCAEFSFNNPFLRTSQIVEATKIADLQNISIPAFLCRKKDKAPIMSIHCLQPEVEKIKYTM